MPNRGDDSQEFSRGRDSATMESLVIMTNDHEKRLRFLERAFFIGCGVVFVIDKITEIWKVLHP
jgi:hypothetical protein